MALSEIVGTGRAVWFTAHREVELRAHEVPAAGPGRGARRGRVLADQPGHRDAGVPGADASRPADGCPHGGGVVRLPDQVRLPGRGAGGRGGSGVELPARATRVARHPHQSLFTMPEGGGLVTPVREDVDQDSAAFANLLDTSMNCLFDVPVRFGDVVAVFGLGIVGLFCALLAARTSDRVVGIDPVPQRRARAASQGVPYVAGPDESPDLVAELSEGRGPTSPSRRAAGLLGSRPPSSPPARREPSRSWRSTGPRASRSCPATPSRSGASGSSAPRSSRSRPACSPGGPGPGGSPPRCASCPPWRSRT